MEEFKIGAKVKIIRAKNGDKHLIGKTGVIIDSCVENPDNEVIVKIDDGVQGLFNKDQLALLKSS